MNLNDVNRPNTHLWQLKQYVDLGASPLPLFGILADWPEIGVNVCSCMRENCGNSSGKHPRIPWKPMTTPATWLDVLSWADEESPGRPYNWAFHLGLSNKVVIDVDPRNGGNEGLGELLVKYGGTPPTSRDRVAGRGFHDWFEAPAPGILPAVTKIVLAPGVDFKHGQGIVVVPPSLHFCGKLYRWEDGREPWDIGFAPLPQWVIDLAWEMAKKAELENPPSPAQIDDYFSHYTPNFDNDSLVERARAYVFKLPPAIQGQNGSGACYRVARVLMVGFALDFSDAWDVMQEYNARCVPPWSDDELRHKLNDAASKPSTRTRGHLRDAERPNRDYDPEGVAGLADIAIPLSSCGPIGGDGASLMPALQSPGTTRLVPIQDDWHTAEPVPAHPLSDLAEAGGDSSESSSASANTSSSSRHACPHCERIKMRFEHRENPGRQRVGFLPCYSWNCDQCYRWQVNRWKARFTHHIGAFRLPVFVGEVSDLDWPRIRQRIVRARGLFGWVRVNETTLLVVATVPFRGGDLMVNAAAINRMCNQVDCIPQDCSEQWCGGRPCYCCAKWPKLEESQSTGEWKAAERLDEYLTRLGTEEILDAYGLPCRVRTIGGGGGGRGKSEDMARRFLEFTIPADWPAVRRQLLLRSLYLGMVVTEDDEFGASQLPSADLGAARATRPEDSPDVGLVDLRPGLVPTTEPPPAPPDSP